MKGLGGKNVKYFVIMEGYLKQVEKRKKDKCTSVFISTLLKGKYEVS